MPKVKKGRSIRLTHPNSRKALQMSRLQHKSGKKNVKIKDQATKLGVTAKKFLWFKENMEPDVEKYESSSIKDLVFKFCARFDSELEQIRIIQNIGRRNPTQHVARERAITLTQENEAMLLRSTGLEIPDLFCSDTVREILNWNGDVKSIPKFKVIKITNNFAKQTLT